MAKVFVLDQKSNLVFSSSSPHLKVGKISQNGETQIATEIWKLKGPRFFSLKLSDLWEVCDGQSFCFGPNVKFNLFVAAQPIAGQGYDSVRVLVLKMSILFAQCVDVQGQPHERQVRLGPHSLWCQSLSYDHQPLW